MKKKGRCDKVIGFYWRTYHYAMTMLLLFMVTWMTIFEGLFFRQFLQGLQNVQGKVSFVKEVQAKKADT